MITNVSTSNDHSEIGFTEHLPTLVPQDVARTDNGGDPEASSVVNAGLEPEVAAKIINEAKDRFERCQTWESTARQRWMDDLKFAEGDAYNQYQWPNAIRRERDMDERPCLTINKTRQHNLHIINDAKQNKPAIKVRATGNGATVESAKVLNAIMRHTEYISNAQVAYDIATGYQVKAGKGYIRLVTDWESDESFVQVPLIRCVNDPLTIYMDPEAKEKDKSDSKFAFIFDDMDREEFDKLYPDYAPFASAQSIDDATGWIREDTVRMAEYFRKVPHEDTIYQVPPAQGQQSPQPGSPATQPQVFKKSELDRAPGLADKIASMPGVKSRKVQVEVIEWYLLVGSKIVERSIWPGKYIPIVPVLGEESVIEGVYDCVGHTRALIDPQRIYNYMSSVSVEYSAVQTKSPWIAPAEAIEGYEVDWANANRINKSLLPYNAMMDDGTVIPPPQRVSPPVSMPAAIQGMQVAANEMLMASGQSDQELGQPGNERSADAIDARTRKSATATFHFTDNQAVAIRCIAKQLLDLYPKMLDATTVMNILAEDGTSMEVQIDPMLQKAVQIERTGDALTIQRVLFNPNVGRYDVQADIGPDWGTKRQETFHALSIMLTQAPQLTSIIGDLLLQSSDFDLADEAAMRLRRMVPPQALGTGPSVNEQQLQAQVQQLGDLLTKSMEALAKEKLKLQGKDAKREVDAYNAFTQRIHALADAAVEEGSPVDPKEIKELVSQVVASAMPVDLAPVHEADLPGLQAGASSADAGGALRKVADEPPIPGARRGRDGGWYVRNYANSGSWARVS